MAAYRIICGCADEDVDNEEVYKMAAVMSHCGGLKVMLRRYFLFCTVKFFTGFSFVNIVECYCDFSEEITEVYGALSRALLQHLSFRL